MPTFKEFLSRGIMLDESINDKGLLKAVFVTGIPGAGKSYTISKLKGVIEPRVINTDRAVEFISKKDGVESTSDNWFEVFEDRAKRITSEILTNCIDGMLPLFIDGTSNNASSIMNRMGILEACGYDVGMVFINTSLGVALERAKERAETIKRHVDEDFIRAVYEKSERNKTYFQTRFNYFEELNNNPGELDDAMISKAYNKVQSFYTSKLQNPVGQDFLESLKESGGKYLHDINGEKWVNTKIGAWYANY